MIKAWKRMLPLALVVGILMSLCSFTVFAESEDAKEEKDPYVYQYQKRQDPENNEETIPDAVKISTFLYDFRWMNSGDDSFFWDNGERALRVSLFRLTRTDGVDETEPIAAYCCDFTNSTAALSLYKRLNLEDSSYFSEDIAKHIRGIMNNGYWHDWTAADLAAAEKAANQWLIDYEGGAISYEDLEDVLPGDAEEPVVIKDSEGNPIDPIQGLSEDQALVATQLAIWVLANTNAYGGASTGSHWIDFYAAQVEGNDYIAEDPYYMPANIKAFYKYLIHQEAIPLNEENILFSDNYFVSASHAMSTAAKGELYDVTVYFKLQGAVHAEDNLEVTAVLGESVVTKALNSFDMDQNGYYSVSFPGVTEADAAQGVNLSLSGYQMVNDVYFYEAKPAEQDTARETSQNLVGWAEGPTPVSAELSRTIPVELGDAAVRLYKVDGSNNHAPLSGAEFSLYYTKDNADLLICDRLIANENGLIEVYGLLQNDTYYFQETKAPDGYILDTTKHYINWSSVDDTTQVPYVTAENVRQGNIDLTGIKFLDGTPSSRAFSFTLTDVTNPQEPELIKTVQNEADGTIDFGTLFYSEPGMYRYEVRETVPNGYNYDPSCYLVSVEVIRDSAGGALSVLPLTISKDGSVAERIEFRNTTRPSGGGTTISAKWQLTAEKTLDGKEADGYIFEMKDENGQTVTASSKNGVIIFPVQNYHRTGEFTYIVTEMRGEQENIVYDDSVYTIKVLIEKSGRSYFVDDVTIEKDGTVTERVIFENTTASEEDLEEEFEEVPKEDPDTPVLPEETDEEKEPDELQTEEPEKEQPKNTESIKDVPATGDSVMLWLLLTLGSGIILLGTVVVRRGINSKKKNHNF